MRTPTRTTPACSCRGETERALERGHQVEKQLLRDRIRSLDAENDALVELVDDLRRQIEQGGGS